MTAKRDLSHDLVRIQHMFDGCDEILAFTKNRDRRDLDKDRLYALAMLKSIEMIGEACSKLSQQFQDSHPEVQWKFIIATRHRLIHGYYDINWDIIWKTIESEIPKLRTQLRNILKNL